jgi:hypothetical protein
VSTPAVAAHHCHADPFATCAQCGRVGPGAFGPNVRPETAEIVEATFEFIEALGSGETFTVPQVVRRFRGSFRSYTTVPKTIRLMEHFGYVRRVERADASGRPILWQRADDQSAEASA